MQSEQDQRSDLSVKRVQTIQRFARAIQYNGMNTDDIRSFVGPEGVISHKDDGTLVLRAQGLPKRRIWFSWWVSIDDSGFISVSDDRAFTRYWEFS